MNTFSWILDGGVVLLAAGVFLTSFHLMNGLVELLGRLWKRLFVTWARRRLRDLGIVQATDAQGQTQPEPVPARLYSWRSRCWPWPCVTTCSRR